MVFEPYHVCFPIGVDDDQEVLLSNPLGPSDGSSGPYHMEIEKDKFWKVGQVLRVSWWNQEQPRVSQDLRNKVMQAAQQWAEVCNISFDFGDHGLEAEVRIAFQPRQGSWSFVGTDCVRPPPQGPGSGEPTMNFGWFDDDTSLAEINRVVLHEFGHALGCIHEHQNPSSLIQWDRKAVMEAYKNGPNKWTEAQITRNILEPLPSSASTAFDPDPVMLYVFDSRLTTNMNGTHSNTQLSRLDKELIRKIYPPTGHSAGVYDTQGWSGPTDGPTLLSPPSVLSRSNTKQFDFDPAYDVPPKIAVGFSRLDVSCGANLTAAVEVAEVTNAYVTVSIDAWDMGTLFGGRAN